MTPTASVLAGLTAFSLLVCAPAPAADASTPAVDTPPHSSAGIGDDDPLAPLVDDYNLQLVFATQGSGEYLADVDVLIADAQGRALLVTRSPGPLFYVRLPAGSYRVRADYAGQTQSKAVTVGRGRRYDIYFYWPGEPSAAGK